MIQHPRTSSQGTHGSRGANGPREANALREAGSPRGADGSQEVGGPQEASGPRGANGLQEVHGPREASASQEVNGTRTRPDSFLDDVLKGLTIYPKSLPCKYFYDARGSRLFDRITELDEYYLTRTELAIMQAHVGDMVDWLGARCLLVEYGSGSSLKTRILLDRMNDPAGYVPIDISSEHLARSVDLLQAAYPHVRMYPICADYTRSIVLPAGRFDAARVVVYFPGSTIGNFEPREIRAFLACMAKVAGPGGGLLIGVDLDKAPGVLEAAYNDAEGITAAFNKNLLDRMNAELGASFRPEAFRHEAVYEPDAGRVDMYLVSEREQTAEVGGHLVRFEEGERIHTEYSHKFTLERFADVANSAGFEVRDVWVDEQKMFSVQYLDVA